MAPRFNHERFEDRLTDFGRALERLRDAMQRPEDEFLRDSIIQRFEFSYELAWKSMKHWLASKDVDVRNPKDTLIAAVEQGLIEDGNAWSELQKYRNLTSHTYNEEVAREVVEFLRVEGLALMEAAHQRLQEWRTGN